MTTPAPTVWPTLVYRDAPAAVRTLVDVFGFRETMVIPEADGQIAHAELRWPEGGGVMLGTAGRTGSVLTHLPTGAASTYVVTDDPDAVFARVEPAGLEVVLAPHDEDYGSHEFTCRDAEGNMWTFGTYRGAP